MVRLNNHRASQNSACNETFVIYAALHAASLALTQVLVVPLQLLVDDTLLLQLLLQLLDLLLHGCNTGGKSQIEKRQIILYFFFKWMQKTGSVWLGPTWIVAVGVL